MKVLPYKPAHVLQRLLAARKLARKDLPRIKDFPISIMDKVGHLE